MRTLILALIALTLPLSGCKLFERDRDSRHWSEAHGRR